MEYTKYSIIPILLLFLVLYGFAVLDELSVPEFNWVRSVFVGISLICFIGFLFVKHDFQMPAYRLIVVIFICLIFLGSVFPTSGHFLLFGILLIMFTDSKMRKTSIVLLFFIPAIITALFIVPVISNEFYPRYKTDVPVILEEGNRFLLNGQNPYSVDYWNTSLLPYLVCDVHRAGNKNINDTCLGIGQIPENFSTSFFHTQEYLDMAKSQPIEKTNPTVTHFVYLPSFFLSAPIQFLFEKAFGFFDFRFIIITAYFLALFALFTIAQSTKTGVSLKAISFVLLFVYIPYVWESMSIGIADIIPLLFLLLFIWLFIKDRKLLASISLGIFSMFKQNFFFVPFFIIAYLLLKKEYKMIACTILCCLLIVATFLIWNSADFIDDTIEYPLGLSAGYNYPIQGDSFLSGLINFGISKDLNWFPSWIFYAFILLPLVIICLCRLSKRTYLSEALILGGICSLCLGYFSRYLWGHHEAAYLSFIIFGFLLQELELGTTNGKTW